MANASRVMSRDSILERVWCDDTSTSNIVDVYVKTLRQKLASEGAPALIHTVYGLGYILKAE